MNFLETNYLMNDSQNGFLNRRSCLTNLLDYFNEPSTMYAETKGSRCSVPSLQKRAFDKVHHRRLLCKSKSHSIDGKILI